MNGVVRIRKKSLNESITYFILVLPFCFGVLNEFLGAPRAIRYSLDLAWVILMFIQCCYSKYIPSKATKRFRIWVALFLAYTLCVYLIEFQSPLYYLWGVRNIFRFYVVFFAFSAFLKPYNVERYMELFEKLFWLNLIVSLIQYFALGYSGDYLGGIFGTEQGGNGYTNIFFLIIVIKSVVFYLEKKETTWTCISKCVTALLVATLAELKFFFIEFIVVIVLAVLFTNFTWRKFWVIIGGGAAVVVGAALLVNLFPAFAGWFSVEWLLETASADRGYTSTGDLNRLNAIPSINEYWLKSWGQRLFGLGLGNCDTSSFSFVNTPFFKANEDMHYTWISYAFMYLECGYIGLIFYFGFFVLLYFSIRKIEKKSHGIARAYCRISRILTVCCPIIAIYNSSLRTEAAYMMYFMLAIPFVCERRFGMV